MPGAFSDNERTHFVRLGAFSAFKSIFVPRHLVVSFEKAEESAASDDDVTSVSRAIMARNKEAYEVLAK